MYFSPQFLETLRDKALLSEVVGKKVLLKKNGKDHIGLCPFHKEKTPSFHVNDSRGMYHCFGCHAHGDVFRFLTEVYNYPFVDAIKEVARATHTPLPVEEIPTAQQQELQDQRKILYEIHEETCLWFQQQLQSSKGYNARQYLAKRGITDETIRQFRLGYATSGNTLYKHLATRGYREQDLIASGIIGQGDEGLYDRFRDRLMFPIFSAKGNVIAFGGRVFGDGLPKYLNSPETLLFSKKNTLFGSHLLKELTRNQPTLYVVEGYMDVIAMVQAGIRPAVAPLGTALTEEQIEMLWKYCPEPVLCFDGDTAGFNAASRASERVLPLLKPGCSLNFTLLPKSEDPDSLIRSGNVEILKQLLGNPRALVDLLWENNVLNVQVKTPEQKALVRKKYLELLDKITDQSVKYSYKTISSERFYLLSKRKVKKGFEASVSAQGIHTKFDKKRLQRYILFATILNHPKLLTMAEEEFSRIDIPEGEEDLNKARDEILLKINLNSSLDRSELYNHMIHIGYESLLNVILSPEIYQHAAFARPESSMEDVREGWQDVWYMLEEKDSLAAQREEMRKELIESLDSETWKRFNALQYQVVKS